MAKIINVDFKKQQIEGAYKTDESEKLFKQIDHDLGRAFDNISKINNDDIYLSMLNDTFIKILFNLRAIINDLNN